MKLPLQKENKEIKPKKGDKVLIIGYKSSEDGSIDYTKYQGTILRIACCPTTLTCPYQFIHEGKRLFFTANDFIILEEAK